MQLPTALDEEALIHLRLTANERARRGLLLKHFAGFQKALAGGRKDEAWVRRVVARILVFTSYRDSHMEFTTTVVAMHSGVLLDLIRKELDDLRASHLRLPHTLRSSSLEVSKYTSARESIENEMERARGEIEGLKGALEKAKQERTNKAEWDKLARQVLQLDSREESLEKLAELKGQLEQLEREKQELEDDWEMRRKQFSALLVAAQQLRGIIAESKARDEEEARGDLERNRTEEGEQGEAMDTS